MSRHPDSIKKLLEEKKSIRVDLGAGGNKISPDWVGIDRQKLPGVDIVHDLEKYPWPLPDECASVVVASHLIEHINPANNGIINFFNEAWRILKFDGEFGMITPYAGSYGFWQDPTHLKGYNEASFYYFDPLHPSGYYRFYRPKPWKIKETTYHKNGNLEVVLIKRRLDKSYEE